MLELELHVKVDQQETSFTIFQTLLREPLEK